MGNRFWFKALVRFFPMAHLSLGKLGEVKINIMAIFGKYNF